MEAEENFKFFFKIFKMPSKPDPVYSNQPLSHTVVLGNLLFKYSKSKSCRIFQDETKYTVLLP